MKLLVATDLSERSDRAMRRAVRLQKKLKAEIEILHVVDDTLPSRIANEVKANAVESIRDQFAGMGADLTNTPKISVVFGHAWEAIVDAVSGAKADLLVMGIHRNRGFMDLFQGTTLHRVARAVDIPVLMVAREASRDYGNVLVGTDFSASAAAAAAEAARLAEPSEIVYLHAYHIPFKGLVMRPDAHGDISARERKPIEDGIKADFDAWVSTLPQDLRKAKRKWLEGGPIRVLEGAVRESNADLLALGQHSRSGFVEAFLGSAARELMSDPPTDLLLTPAR